MDVKESFLSVQGQTNPFPYLIEVEKAEGVQIFDVQGNGYLDMIAGVAVNNIGHNHPKVIAAIREQIDRHLHVMVYGEFIQRSQLNFAKKLTSLLPNSLNCVYTVNSGTEANEAAIKLAKRLTGRSEMISFRGSYHGSTHGSLSVSGNETKKEAYRPLLPEVRFIEFNETSQLTNITRKTAGVIIETVQGDAGVRIPSLNFMQALRDRCNEVGAQLIFDEIQCGIGRAGSMFAFEQFNVIPDILTLGKGLGGGMPIGAIVASKQMLKAFTHSPMLGHITTFGGHPVVCAAALACLEVMTSEIDFKEVERLGKILEDQISIDSEIKEIRRIGMMFAFDMESFERVEKVVKKCLEKGLISFWFLSHPYSFRLSPPLNITEDQIRKAGSIILESIAETRE
ncbi:MAG: aspartate aminotransferase family protein [Crocinitomicaceae bacterium]|nr:aspartate aminotransferase family protein [Crocinitomicaceae bacterium]